jgi:hypothetical protein
MEEELSPDDTCWGFSNNDNIMEELSLGVVVLLTLSLPN